MRLFEILAFTVNAIFPLLLLIFLGYLLKKWGLLNKDFIKTGNKLVFRVCLPVLLFCNIIELEALNDIPWNAVIYAVIAIAILLVISFGVSMTTNEPTQKGVMMQCVFRSNFALIGIPLAELIGGSEGVTAAAILSAFSIPIYNILAVIVLTSFVDNKAERNFGSQLIKIAKNPLIIGVMAGIVCLFLKQLLAGTIVVDAITKMSFIHTALNYVSRMATPLALIVLGGQFEFNSIKGYRKQIVIATISRTIVAPLIAIGGAYVVMRAGITSFSPAVFAAYIALFGTPVAVASAIMADEMNNDGQLAAQLVVWTSLVSIFTLFVIIFLSRLVGII